jgi:hypothetical protein
MKGHLTMLESLPPQAVTVPDEDTVAAIADALTRKFGIDAPRVAQAQVALAGQDTVASWLAVVEHLRG